MKWFWVVDCDNTVKNPFVADSEDLKGVNEWDLCIGKSMRDWDAAAWFQAKKPKNDGNPDDILQNALGLPIYSARLQNALKKSGVRGIQYLPIKVLRPNGSLIDGFAIANILNLIPALDLEKSDYDLFPNDYFLPERRGQFRAIRKAVLRRASLSEHDIIRLKEFELNIYVSERFKKVFEEGKFTGYSFHECELS